MSFKLVQVNSSVGQFGQHLKPSLTLKRLGTIVERRARLQPCRKWHVRVTALAVEVRFSRSIGRSHLFPQLRSPQTIAKRNLRGSRVRA
jgi:hypothetical protein